MIEKLTPEQEGKLGEYRDRWLAIGLSTEKADRPTAERAINAAYKEAGLTPPKQIVWADGPLGCLRKAVELGVPEAEVYNQVPSFVYGCHDAPWLGCYEFFMLECGVKDAGRLQPFMDLARSCGWCLLYDEAAICSERPTAIHMNNGLLHRDGGPALEFADGLKVWALNGVRVSQEIAETPATKLSSKLVTTETNAEVRREIVRKIGIEKVCKSLKAEVIDKEGDYELMLLDLGDGRKRPYLKMINPSTSTYHIEGVHPDCKTVKAALEFRNGTSEVPEKLT